MIDTCPFLNANKLPLVCIGSQSMINNWIWLTYLISSSPRVVHKMLTKDLQSNILDICVVAPFVGQGHPSKDTLYKLLTVIFNHHQMPAFKVSHRSRDKVLPLDTPLEHLYIILWPDIFEAYERLKTLLVCWQFCIIYKEQLVTNFQLVLVRLEFCWKAAWVCGQKVDPTWLCGSPFKALSYL